MNNCFCDAAWKIQCILTYIFISFIHYFFSAIIRHRMQKRMAAAISFLLFACGASAANRWRAEKYDERWDACTLEFCFNIDRLRGKRGRERERYYHGRRIKETMKKACGRQMVPNTNNACVLNSEAPTQSLSTFSWPVGCHCRRTQSVYTMLRHLSPCRCRRFAADAAHSCLQPTLPHTAICKRNKIFIFIFYIHSLMACDAH